MTYEVLIDKIDKDKWEQQAREFADYSIYQTWPYQQVRAENSDQSLSRAAVLDENGNVSTMCQVRIKHIILLGIRIGYVQWGPLLRGKDGKLKCNAATLETLRDAYLGAKVNILRVVPNVYKEEFGAKVTEMLETSGFRIVPSVKHYHTMMFPTDISADEMRRQLHYSWRKQLKRAEQTGLDLREGSDLRYFSILEQLYRASVRRKGFKGLDPEEFIQAQQMLSDNEKMNVVVAYFNGQPVAAHASSYLGDTAVGILAASNEKGLELGASYLVWWRTLLAAKSAGMRRYDLGGIDPKNNPTVYQFKQRMGAHEVFHIGAFEAHSSTVTRNVWCVAERVYRFVKA